MSHATLVFEGPSLAERGLSGRERLAVVLVIAAVFAFDILTPEGIGIAFLYVPILWTALLWGTRRLVMVIAAACSLLAIIDPVFFENGALEADIINRIITLMTLWFLVYFGLFYRQLVTKLHNKLERQVAERTAELSEANRTLIEEAQQRKRVDDELREREELLHVTFDTAPVGINIVSPEGRFLHANAAYQRMMGYTEEELRHKTTFDLIHQDDLPRNRILREELLAGGDSFEIEKRNHTKDGGLIWVRTKVSPVKDGLGNLRFTVGVSQDITARKQLQQALSEAEQRLRFLITTVPAVIYSCDIVPPYRVSFITENVKAQMGYDAGHFIRDSNLWLENIHPDDLAPVFAELGRLAGPQTHAVEYRFRHKNGAYRWLHDGWRLVRDADGHPKEIVGFRIDITERKRAEAQRAQLAAIVENANVAILSRTLDGIITSWNPGAEKMLGYTAAEAIGRGATFTVPPGRRPNLARNNESMLRGEVMASESDRMTKDGRVIDVLTSHSPIRDDAGNIIGASVILQDVSALKQAQAAVKESEERLRAAFDQAAVGMALRGIDPRDSRWLRVNQKLCEIFGYTREELLQLTSVDVTLPEERHIAIEYNEQLLRGDITSYSREKRYVRKNGEIFWANISVSAVRGPDGHPTHVITAIQDVTERKRAEEALRRSEERFFKIFRSSPIPVAIATVDEARLVDVNDSYLEFFGYGRDEVVGRTPAELGLWVDPDHRAELREKIRTGGSVRNVEARFRRKSGEIVIALFSMENIQIQDESFYIAMRVDVTEARRAEEERTRYLHRLRTLSRRLVETQETERRRLAAELHDRIGQNLTALTINLNIVRSQLSPESEAQHAARLEDSRALVEATIESVRDAIAELRPTVLDDYGLLAALRWYGKQFEKRSGVVTTVEAQDLFPRLPSQVEAALYRIAQEALNNTLKHATARRATLRLDADTSRVALTVADDGDGFDSVLIGPHGMQPGWGLLMMRERAESVGGRLRVESAPSHGTRVVVEVDRRA